MAFSKWAGRQRWRRLATPSLFFAAVIYYEELFLKLYCFHALTVEGVIFTLQNNYGYTERREVDFGPQASRALTASAVPMAEREALLRELFQEFSQEGAAPDGAGET